MTHFGEKWREGGTWGVFSGVNTQMGCNILWDSRLTRLYLVALPCNPQCGYPVRSKALALKASSCGRAQRPAQRGPGVCPRPLINCWVRPSSCPNGSHLCCHHHANQLSTPVKAGFCASERYNCIGFDPSPSATSRHLRGATQIKSLASSVRSFDLGRVGVEG